MTEPGGKNPEQKQVEGENIAVDGDESRRETRFRTIFSGAARFRGKSRKAIVYDLSASGAKITDIDLIPIGGEVDIVIDRLGQFNRIHGVAVWRRSGRIGIKFSDPPEKLHELMARLLPSRWALDKGDS